MSDFYDVVAINRAGIFRECQARSIKVQTRDQALQKLREDKAAWVRPEDVQPVLDAWRAEHERAMTLPAWAAEYQQGVQP
jgi:hypothetical protein